MKDRTYAYLQCQALTLMQSLLGVISSNFRMVWITSVEDMVVVSFVLEQESDQDFEEIEDLRTEFESLQLAQTTYEFEIKISSGEISWPDASRSIVVYRRRESL